MILIYNYILPNPEPTWPLELRGPVEVSNSLPELVESQLLFGFAGALHAKAAAWIKVNGFAGWFRSE